MAIPAPVSVLVWSNAPVVFAGASWMPMIAAPIAASDHEDCADGLPGVRGRQESRTADARFRLLESALHLILERNGVLTVRRRVRSCFKRSALGHRTELAPNSQESSVHHPTTGEDPIVQGRDTEPRAGLVSFMRSPPPCSHRNPGTVGVTWDADNGQGRHDSPGGGAGDGGDVAGAVAAELHRRTQRVG